jgi:asparagine synthase (glutamine-hydrolysing)
LSGICGALGLDGRPQVPADVAPMLRLLSRLGPDGQGDWAGDAGRLGVALGVALRRRVPEDRADRQPVSTGGGDVVVVADIVLDNRAELAAQLGEPDRPDVPDSRLLLAAYLRWGDGCLARLRGDFALAIADRRRGGVLLARDQVGTRPLHVYRRPGTLAFASTALALTAFPGAGAALDTARLAEFLAGVMASERSWIAGIDPVPPGAALWVTAGGVRQWRYWQLDVRHVAASVPADEQVAALRDAFDAAVRARLRRTGAVGATVSGGLDSTSVVATAALALAPEPLRTYTSAPPPGWQGAVRPGFEADESRLVIDLAGRYPTLRPRFLDARGWSFLAGWEEIFATGGVPARNPCNMTWLGAIHVQAAADGVSTLFTGAGGNLFFSADDPRWMADLIRHGRLTAAARELRAWAPAGAPLWPAARHTALAELAPVRLVRWYHAARNGRLPRRDAAARWLAGTALRAQVRVDVSSLLPALDERRGRALRDLAMAALLGRAAQAELRAGVDAWSGLRTTDPTLDIEVLRLCAAQPSWVRRQAGLTRAGCRLAMADRLPDSIRLRTARGAQLPDWLDRMTDARAELAAELAAIADDPVAREVIDVQRLAAAMRDWPAPSEPLAAQREDTYRAVLLRGLLAGRYARWLREEAPSLRDTPAAVHGT